MNTVAKKLFVHFDLNQLWIVCWAAFTFYYWIYMGFEWNSSMLFVGGDFLLSAGLGLLASYVLWSVGFFDLLRIIPRKSDILLILFAMAVSASLKQLFLTMIFDRPGLSLSVLVTLPVYASVFFVGYEALTGWLSQVRKRRVTLRLRDDEVQEFIAALEEAGLTDEIEILSPSQMLKEFANHRRRKQPPRVDLIVFSRGGTRDMQTDRFLLRAHLWGVPMMDRRACMTSLTRRVSVHDIDVWSYVSSALPQTAWIRFGRLSQELIEPVIALVMMIALLPVFIAVAIAIKISSPGPVFYSQRRTGYMGKIFMLYKFRSMRTDSEVNGAQWSSQGDTRITPIGRIIRKTRLDELPQLWNVVRRDMCFVGPRPERPEIYRDLKAKIPLFSLRTDVRPGITGWAQVCAGYAASIEESELKLEHDLYYIQHMSIRLDLVVMLMTAKVVLYGDEYISKPAARSRPVAEKLAEMADMLPPAQDPSEERVTI